MNEKSRFQHRKSLGTIEIAAATLTSGLGALYLAEAHPAVLGGAHIALGIVLFAQGMILAFLMNRDRAVVDDLDQDHDASEPSDPS